MSENVVRDAVISGAGSQFSKEKPKYDTPYGVGTWPKAVLTGVVRFAQGEKVPAFKLGLNFNLRPENEESPMPLKGRIDLPRTLEANGHPVEDWMLAKEAKRLEVLNRFLFAAAGVTMTGNVDTEEQYNNLVAVFEQSIGETVGVKVTADYKNIKDDSAPRGWRKEATGYTTIDGIQKRGK